MTKSLIIILFWVFWALPAQGAASDPQGTVEKLLQSIQKIRTGDHLSREQRVQNRELSDQALNFLDLKQVSRKTLGKHWRELSPEEQENFVVLLSQLFVEVAFPNSGKFFSDLKIIYEETGIENNRATVPVRVIHPDEGEVSIVFHLARNSADWRVVDVDLDGISMRNNLRSQFFKIIAKNNYRELIRRMEKKLEESRS